MTRLQTLRRSQPAVLGCCLCLSVAGCAEAPPIAGAVTPAVGAAAPAGTTLAPPLVQIAAPDDPPTPSGLCRNLTREQAAANPLCGNR